MSEDLRIAAASPEFEKRVQSLAESVQARFRYHSIELPDGSVLPGLQSVEHLRWRLSLFPLPEDLRGKRVLDIGAWDGWFSFECERRGAEVVAVDCVALDTFLEAKELLGSKVDYRTLDVAELSAAALGRFDIVLFFGVLYHLRHPLMGLEKVVELSTDLALIESFVIASEARPIPAVMEFYERGELGGQIDNWCGPSPEGLLAMCRSAGFAQVELRDVTNQRASVVCRRRWPEPPAADATKAPHLISAINSRTWAARFHVLKDEYICCFFKSDVAPEKPEDVLIEIDGYGIETLAVAATGEGGYQANCLRPAGLDPGLHRVVVRTAGSARSNPVEFVMLGADGAEMPVFARQTPALQPDFCSAEYQPSGDRRIALNRAGTLVCYFRADAEIIAPGDVSVDAVGAILTADSVGTPEPGVWQANFLLQEPLGAGAELKISIAGGAWSNAVRVTA